MKPLKCAVIGTGHLGKIHARLLTQVDGAELVAVVDPDPAARDKAASECGAAAVADYRELGEGIDAAIVATPTRLHHPITKDLLKSGVHCLVEKPVTQTVEEADELIDIANAQGLVLAVGHVERFNPAVAAAAPHVADPKYITATRAGTYTFRSTDVSIVHDLMIHDLDVVLSLVQSPLVDVAALGVAVFGPHEDMAQARLTFANGCIADLVASRTSPQPARQMNVFCETGFAGIDFATRTATLVSLSPEIQGRQIDVHAVSPEQREAIKETLFDAVLPLTEIKPGEANPLLDEQRDFVASVRGGHAPRVCGPHARDALAAAERILSSICRHRWDGTIEGRVGPHLIPSPHVFTGPRWDGRTPAADVPHRKAG
jgi:predicted dehydrogenase